MVRPGATPGRAASAADGASDKPSKEGPPRGFRELREALKILQSLKNMTVEQLWTGGSPTSPTSVESAAAASLTAGGGGSTSAGPEKPTKEQRFLDDIKKLQETLKKTLDNVAIVEEEKMEAVVEAGGSVGGASAAEVSVRRRRPVATLTVQPAIHSFIYCSGSSWVGYKNVYSTILSINYLFTKHFDCTLGGTNGNK